MNSKSIFLIATTVILTVLFGVFQSDFKSVINFICLALILFVGIPHGALDNFLLQRNTKLTTLKFHLFYSSSVLAYILLWFLSPSISLLIFILISAYHFGESQLSVLRKPFMLSKMTHFFWGLSIILTLFLFNYDEFYFNISKYDVFQPIISVLDFAFLLQITVISNFVLLVLFILIFKLKLLTLQKLSYEILCLSILYFAFHFLDLTVGFTIYFVFWHSLVVMKLIWNYFTKAKFTIGMLQFIKLLLPNTVISILIGFILFSSINFLNFEIDFTSVVFVLLSALTLPHVFIMEKFNEKVFKA
jgi:Brp/Blh family beta-carotene 15,15'-monooxygenase